MLHWRNLRWAIIHWKKKKLKLFVLFIMLFIVYFLIRQLSNQSSTHLHNPDFSYLNLPDDNLPAISMTIMEKFPDSGPDKIPRIIHQTWKTDDIPYLYVDWVKSWHVNQPDWQYWFWTDKNTREFIAEKYPAFLKIFDNYSEPIRRADAMRYFILYEFGGVYVDLDMESLKPLDPIIRKYHCFLGQEPFIHPMIDSNFEHLTINAIMGCRKGHPFMKLLIDQIPKFSHMWHVLDSTGPHFLKLWYEDYKKYNYDNEHLNGTYLAPPDYFFPTIDPSKFSDITYKCNQYKTLLVHQKRACQYLKKTSGSSSNFDLAFTHHHWVHTYFVIRIHIFKPINIHKLVGLPNLHIWKP